MVEVDVSALVRWREQHREEFQRRAGVDLTYLAPFVQVAVAASLAPPTPYVPPAPGTAH